MRLSRIALGAAAFAVCVPAAFAQAGKPDPSHITFTPPKDVQWKIGEARTRP